MPTSPSDEALDPRPTPTDAGAAVDVGGRSRGVAGGPIWPAMAAVGALVTVIAASATVWTETHRPPPRQAASHSAEPMIASAPPPPAELMALTAAAHVAAPPPVPALPAAAEPGAALVPATPVPAVAPPAALFTPGAVAPPSTDKDGKLPEPRNPVLIVDLTQGGVAPTASADAKGGKGTVATAPTPALNGDEQFASRVSTSQPERSRATFLRNKGSTVPQGAMIPAVLETALDSDLPGFARAVVSRDVRSFDGSQVLIPRGSRVIGEYRSGVAQGASRAFVIWERVLRPDGVSIQIGSSGADELGRAGLPGRVDRHFFERFGGALLLSVISLGQSALNSGNSTQVVIGSSSDASSLAGAASAFAPQNISPTIKVLQGTAIRIFVARDLDFAATKAQ